MSPNPNRFSLTPDRYNELSERLSGADENYELLRSEKFKVGKEYAVWSSELVRARHMHDTDRIIGMLDGSIEERVISDPDNYERSHEVPDVVIPLDKSGRPIKDLVEAFWEFNAKDGAELPEFDFLNIDRIDWLARMGYSATEADQSTKKTLDMSKISHEEISRIRAYFTEGDLTEENWQEEVWQLPTRLDGKKILVLDEVKNSGATLEIATKLIKTAIPEAVISGDYYWTDSSHDAVGSTNAQTQWKTVPKWYDGTNSFGRGIGDTSPAWHEKQYEENPSQQNLKNKIASFVLSAPHHDRHTFAPVDDVLYKKLVQDIAFMSYDYPVLPPHQDRDEGWKERIDDIAESADATYDEAIGYRLKLSQNGRKK